jgi:hypothetical protein
MELDYSSVNLLKMGVAVCSLLILIGTITLFGVRYSKSVHDAAEMKEKRKRSLDIIYDDQLSNRLSLGISVDELLEIGIEDDLQLDDKHE